VKKTSDDFYGDETHEALKNIVPADVFALDTAESRKVAAYYKKHTYWLSEMYLLSLLTPFPWYFKEGC
jgi:hypothetical protein